MNRFIKLINKPQGNNFYVCDGSGCDVCAIRYKCFTANKIEIVEVDWSMIKTNKSPARFLASVTGSKIYVQGSKRHKQIGMKILGTENVKPLI